MPFPNPSTQFQPGQSGNLHGRPRKGLITDEAESFLLEEHPKYPGKTRKRIIAERWVERAEVEGKDLATLLDRVEGKIPDPTETPGLTMETIAEMEAADGRLDTPAPEDAPGQVL